MPKQTTQFDFGGGLTPVETFNLYEEIIIDRGSRYSVSIGHVKGRADIKKFLKRLKQPKLYQKATHHSWAARLRHDGVVYETKADDGETGAGQVILRQLQKHDVINGIVCVTRWFGGTKLEGDRFRHLQNATLYAIKTIKSSK